MLDLNASRFNFEVSLLSYTTWPVVGMPRRSANAKVDLPRREIRPT